LNAYPPRNAGKDERTTNMNNVQGCHLTFLTQQTRRFNGERLTDWLLSQIHAVTPEKLDLLCIKIPLKFGTLQKWTTRS